MKNTSIKRWISIFMALTIIMASILPSISMAVEEGEISTEQEVSGEVVYSDFDEIKPWDGETIVEPLKEIVEGKEVYSIHTAEELMWFNQNWKKDDHVLIKNHIRLNAPGDYSNTWNVISPSEVNQGGAFEGTFEGNGFTIAGLSIQIDNKYEIEQSAFGYIQLSSRISNVGFFGYLQGQVKNLNLQGKIEVLDRPDSSYGDWMHSGGIAGSMGSKGVISGCSADMEILHSVSDEKGSVGPYPDRGYPESCDLSIGSIAGYSYRGNIENCYSHGKIFGGGNRVNRFGGIIGETTDAGSSVKNCYSTTDMSFYTIRDTLEGSFVSRMGGIVGETRGSTVQNNFALNKNLEGGDGKGSQAGFVIGNIGREDNRLKNNFALEGMNLKNFTEIQSSNGKNTANGEIINEKQAKNEKIYQENQWSEDIWQFEEGNYPRFKNKGSLPPNEEKLDIVEIEIENSPTKVDYYEGDLLDLNGLTIKLIYNDGSSREFGQDQLNNLGITAFILRESGRVPISEKLQAQDTSLQLEMKNKEEKILQVELKFINMVTQYTVKFDSGSHGAVSTSTQKYLEQILDKGDKVNYFPAIIPKKGFTFNGWQDQEGLFKTTENIKSLPVTEDRSYTALYSTIQGELIIDKIPDPELRRVIIAGMNYSNPRPNQPDIDTTGIEYPLFTSDLPAMQNIKRVEFSYSPSTEKQIMDLTGLELLSNLESFSMRGTKIPNIDLSKMSSLTSISVNNTAEKVDSIALPENSKLKTLYLYNTKINSLDLSKQKLLESADIFSNDLEFVDTSGLSNLKKLNLYKNPRLTNLALKEMKSLETLDINNCGFTHFDIGELSNLKAIKAYENKLTRFTMTGHEGISSVELQGNQLKTVDLKGTKNLQFIDISNNPLELISLKDSPSLERVNLKNANLKSLDLSGSPSLLRLFINNEANKSYQNEIMEIDTSENHNLTELNCQGNLLRRLDLRKNKKLSRVFCDNNRIEELLLSPDCFITSTNYSGISAGNNHLVKFMHEPGVYNGATSFKGQSRKVQAEKLNNSYQVDMKELLGNDGYSLLQLEGIIGGTIEEETGLLTTFPGVHSVIYPIKIGNPMGQIMNVVLNFEEEKSNEILRIENPEDQNIVLNGKADLPKEINVFYEDGTAAKQNVVWEELDTSAVKSISLEGVVEGTDKKAIAHIEVVEIQVLEKISVIQDSTYSLPKFMKVKYESGMKDIPVEWSSEVEPSVLGEKEIEGSLQGIGKIIQMIEVVEKTEDDVYLLDIPDPSLRRQIFNRMNKSGRIIPDHVEIPSGFEYPLFSTDLEAIGSFYFLYLNGPDLKDLKGIEYCSSLINFSISNSPELKEVDLSKNLKLENVTIRDHNVETFVIGKNHPTLKTLQIERGKLKSLDVTGAGQLTGITANSNELTELHIDGVNKLQILSINDNKLTQLKLDQNPALRNITANNNQIQGLLDLKLNKELISISVENNKINEILAEDMPKLTTIKANQNEISKVNLKDCVALATLELNDNELAEFPLDLTSLKNLYLADNKLTSIDLSPLSELQILHLSNTDKGKNKNKAMEKLSLSENSNLTQVYVNALGLKEIDFGEKPQLQIFQGNSNAFEKLDFSSFPRIRELYLDNNKLSELEIPISTATWGSDRLSVLHVRNNQLKKLATETASGLRDVKVAGNQLAYLNFISSNTAANSNPIFSSQKRRVDAVVVEDKLQIDLKEMGVKDSDRITNLVGGRIDAEGMITLDEGFTSVSYLYQTNASGATYNTFPETRMAVQLIVDTKSNQYNPIAQRIEVEQNGHVNVGEGIANKEELPEGTTYHLKEEVDTSILGEKKVIIIVNYPDNTKKEIVGSVMIIEKSNPYDFNGDGVVNIKDTSNLLQYISNSDGEYIEKYDLTKDGVVNILDVRALLNIIAKS